VLVASYQRMVRKPGIARCVWHYQHRIHIQCMHTKRLAMGNFRDVDPMASLEPLALLIDESQERDRGVEHASRQLRDALERSLWTRVHDAVPAQRVETRRLVDGRRAGHGGWIALGR
jgi:hypothetical protein